MIVCTHANLVAILRAERPALLHWQQGLHLTSATCEGRRWTLDTREGVTLTITVKRTSHKRIAAYEDGTAVVATPTGQIMVQIVGAVA